MHARLHTSRSFLGNEIERVRDLERHLGVAAGEIALLVADAGENRNRARTGRMLPNLGSAPSCTSTIR
jgi:hypothetical protein